MPQMNGLQQRKLPRHEPNPNPNTRPLCNVMTGSLLTYQAIRALLRESDTMERDIRERGIRDRNIRERDFGERDIREMDIRETVTTCLFPE
jgi:hypothetical protein